MVNPKVSICVGLCSEIEELKIRIMRLETHLSINLRLLSDEEFKEYAKETEGIEFKDV